MIKSWWAGAGRRTVPVRKVALITGITGQDGAYLVEFLLNKDYTVHGIKRRASSLNTQRIDHLYKDAHDAERRFFLHYGDLTDSSNLIRLVEKIEPDEIYNLGAMSHVGVSFDSPEYTADVNGLGILRVLEAVRITGSPARIYQASTSELYGQSRVPIQSELTPFYPRSPYAAAKLFGYWMVVNYREAYGMFASNGILFNHESPLRGETFVTRKITRGVARIAKGWTETIWLGNLDACRDWGHAADYVRAMWMILQHSVPDDFVIATGITTSVREFARLAFASVGMQLEFTGQGVHEVGAVAGRKVIAVDPRYFRPTEVDLLCGDATKAAAVLGWRPERSLGALIAEMVRADLAAAPSPA